MNRELLLKRATRKTAAEEGGFLNFLKPLISAGLPLMTKLLTPFTKSVLVPLRLTAVASATDPAVDKKDFGSGMITLIFSNEELDYVGL